MKGGEDLMNLEIATGNYKSEKCKCLCAVFEKRGIRELPNKSASHFLSVSCQCITEDKEQKVHPVAESAS